MDRRAGMNVTCFLEAAAHLAGDDGRPGDAALFRLASDTIAALLGPPADDPALPVGPPRKFTTVAVATTSDVKPAAEHRHKYGASGTCMTEGCGAARKNKVRAPAVVVP